MRVCTPLAALAGIGCLLTIQTAQAQVSWRPVPTGLPPSIELFETGATGDSLHAWYVRADLSDTSVRLEAARSGPNAVASVSQFAASNGAFVAVNGGFFSGTESRSLIAIGGGVVWPNEIVALRDGVLYYPTRSALGRLSHGRLDIAWEHRVYGDVVEVSYPNPSPNAPGRPQPRPTLTFPDGGSPWYIEAGVGGGPMLVQNGRPRITWEEEVFFGTEVDTTTASARTVGGRTVDGRLLLLVADAPGLTLPEAADLMVSLGAVEALNLDGGASSALWADGAALLPGGRPVVSALVLRPRFSFDPPLTDTGDACCYRETGVWTESADSLFYGATRSRLGQVGAETRAVFTFEEPGQSISCGRIRAWWSTGPDRATDVTFTAYGEYGTRTFGPFDQTDPATAGRWNTVGYGTFSSSDSLVVAAGAVGPMPTVMSVDAVRMEQGACPANESEPGAALGLAVAPNPTRGSAAATFTLAAPADVRVSVVDLLGRTVREERVRLAAGEQSVQVETEGLAAGLYVVRVEAGAGVATARLSVVR